MYRNDVPITLGTRKFFGKKRKEKKTLVHNITLSLVSIHHNIRNTELLATLKLDLQYAREKNNHVTTCVN